MVSQTEKSQAASFICEKLEDSGLYIVQNVLPGKIVVREKTEVREQPRTICTVIANFYQPIAEFRKVFERNQQGNVYTAPMFYKDGKTAFVRLMEARKTEDTTETGLVKYTDPQIQEMISLRGIEKEVLKDWEAKLVYYQPETNKTEEALIKFDLGIVHLNYDHLTPSDLGYGFAKNHDSVDYKLPMETGEKFPAVQFGFYLGEEDPMKRAMFFPTENRREKTKTAEAELFETALDQYPKLDPKEALEALSPKN